MSRRPTIVDVAERAGVSKSLVSLVMHDSPRVSARSREAVLEAARELGYQPNAVARSLVRRTSHVIGCIISDLHNPFFADIADGIEEAAVDHGYRALLSAGFLEARREAIGVETLVQLLADGLILLGPWMREAEIAEAARGTPVVLVGLQARSRAMDSVRNDDFAGARAIVDHLVDLGHERIAHIHAGTAGGARERRRGYEAAMRRHGLRDAIRSVPGDYTEAGGRAAMRSILDSGDVPSAVFVANDFAALGALEVLLQAGRQVPGDVSIAGYDDITVAGNARVGLTTVAQPAGLIGRTAVDLIIERIDGRIEPRRVVLPPALVVRATTAPPAQKW